MSPSAGAKLGLYAIVASIGKGGMGGFCLARGSTRRPKSKAIATMNHPNICQASRWAAGNSV
jgi:hypothetical protein